LDGGFSLLRLTDWKRRLVFANHHLLTQPAGNVLDVQYEETTHQLLACYNGGLVVRSAAGHWRDIASKQGLLVDGCWSLAALSNGDVWYDYYNTVAFVLLRPQADGRFQVRQFRAGDDLLDLESLTFDPDRRGWLWRGGNHGMSVADPAAAESGKWLHFDRSDGLPAEAVNSGTFFSDRDGSVWWGAANNIAHYTPSPGLVKPQAAPQVFVSAFSWNGGAPRLAEAAGDVPHGARVVALIGSLQFDRCSALRLRYRILPGESTWRETRSLDLPLGQLASGSHTLELQGRVFTGPWSPAVRRPFTVLRPAWLAWPFLAACFLAGGGLATIGYWLRRQHRAEEAELLPDLSAWRMGALLPEVHSLSGTILDGRFLKPANCWRAAVSPMYSPPTTGTTASLRRQGLSCRDCRQGIVHRRFEQEVAALVRVRHPNVVAIYAHGKAPTGAPYLVMEFVEGRNLREALKKSRCRRAASRACSRNGPVRSTPSTRSASATAT